MNCCIDTAGRCYRELLTDTPGRCYRELFGIYILEVLPLTVGQIHFGSPTVNC